MVQAHVKGDRMGDYTVANLMEVEDQAPGFGLAPNLEARFAREALGLQTSGLSYQRLAPNFRMPFGHTHGEQEEVYVILEGSARMALDDEVIELSRWDAVRVPRETARSFEAGPDGVAFLAFGAPRTPETEGADARPIPGWWPDE
jgi:mannose-6-phosphate isomerase-like protein (cupin superfamily)